MTTVPATRNGKPAQGGRQWEGGSIFATVAYHASRATGRAPTFSIAVVVIVVWAVSGPVFGFSDTWQLVINTGTTIVTFLMVFLIQNTQNRDSAAIQVKLDELLRAGKASNGIVGIEHLSQEEIDEIRERCEKRAQEKSTPAAERKTARKAAKVSPRATG
jgi:low affinity Fe/Cu permease